MAVGQAPISKDTLPYQNQLLTFCPGEKMRQLTGIVYTILLAVTSGWAQQNGIEVKLAEKLGL